MPSGERFAFKHDATGAEVLTTSGKTPGTTDSSAPLERLLQKWGLSLCPENGELLLQRLTYRIVCDNDSRAGSGATAAATSLRFHDGMAANFLTALFADESVKQSLEKINKRAKLLLTPVDVPALSSAPQCNEEFSASCPVIFRKRTCRWTDLGPLDSQLLGAKVIRRGAAPTEDRVDVDGTAMSFPVVKRKEEVLPGDIVIADELRALFLQARSRRSLHSRGDGDNVGDLRSSDADNSGGEDDDHNPDDGEDDEDGFDAYGYGYSAKLSKQALLAAFSSADRRELLYHLMWRLVAGGGAMNQFEDDYGVYRSAVRDLYKAMVTSLVVRCVEVDHAGDVEEGTPSAERKHAGGDGGRCLVPEVASLVYEVKGMGPRAGRLFPRSDGVTPSNLNYCYVVVNPQQQMVVIFYHGAS